MNYVIRHITQGVFFYNANAMQTTMMLMPSVNQFEMTAPMILRLIEDAESVHKKALSEVRACATNLHQILG